MSDSEKLSKTIRSILIREWPNTSPDKADRVANRICDAVSEWMPKKGALWMTEPDGKLYVNQGWKLVE